MGKKARRDSPKERRAAGQPRPFEEVIARLDGLAGWAQVPHVSTMQAMQVATVMACVRVIANGCATPDLHVYRDDASGKRVKARDVPEYRLLNRRPNEWQTSYEWRRTMTMHALLDGAGLSVKVMSNGRLAEIIPVRPGSYVIERRGRYDLVFHINDEFGRVGTFDMRDVFYLPNLQWDGYRGLSAVALARSAIGLSMSAESSQAQLHENGGRPAGILTVKDSLSPESLARLRASWSRFTREDRGGTAFLDNGATYAPLSMSGVDSQHIETRRFQVEEICRAFDVFPMMIGHSDKTATFASTEAFFGGHLKHTLMPWHAAWVQRLDEWLLDGDGPLYCQFDTRYLTAGSMKDRATWLRTLVEMGIYTPNEAREEEGMDPLPGLDQPLRPLNMTSNATADAAEEDDA
jgi:HK97 family phage portal protein